MKAELFRYSGKVRFDCRPQKPPDGNSLVLIIFRTKVREVTVNGADRIRAPRSGLKMFCLSPLISAWFNLLHYLRIFDDHLGTKFDDIETWITIMDVLKQR